VEGLRHEMAFASEQQQYEKAGVVRDKIRSIERTMESQKMAAFARTELDLAALARKDDQAAVQLFVVRNGKMLGRDVFFLDAHHDVGDDEVLGSFLEQYYARATSVPREVLVPRSLADTADLEAFLMTRRGSIVRIRTPQRGEKRELMELATRNAQESLAREADRLFVGRLGLVGGNQCPAVRVAEVAPDREAVLRVPRGTLERRHRFGRADPHAGEATQLSDPRRSLPLLAVGRPNCFQ
jgi:hypothetical protein